MMMIIYIFLHDDDYLHISYIYIFRTYFDDVLHAKAIKIAWKYHNKCHHHHQVRSIPHYLTSDNSRKTISSARPLHRKISLQRDGHKCKREVPLQ